MSDLSREELLSNICFVDAINECVEGRDCGCDKCDSILNCLLDRYDAKIRADAINECENYLIDSFNRVNSNEMLSIGKVIEVFILLFNQLKENKE